MSSKSQEANMDFKIEKFSAINTASVRNTGPYESVTAAWMTLLMNPCIMPLINESTMYIGVCYDDPRKVAEAELRYDACVSGVEGFVCSDPVKPLVIEAGDYAVYRHVGSYKGLAEAYPVIYEKLIPEAGRKPKSGAASLQIYRNLPINTPEDQLITDVCVPLD